LTTIDLPIVQLMSPAVRAGAAQDMQDAQIEAGVELDHVSYDMDPPHEQDEHDQTSLIDLSNAPIRPWVDTSGCGPPEGVSKLLQDFVPWVPLLRFCKDLRQKWNIILRSNWNQTFDEDYICSRTRSWHKWNEEVPDLAIALLSYDGGTDLKFSSINNWAAGEDLVTLVTMESS
jgi:hypothetical protein